MPGLVQYEILGSKRQKDQSFVYIIQNLVTENIKIGFSLDPYERINTFQVGCDCELSLLCFFPGTVEDEQMLHAGFSEFNIQGEWFQFSKEIQEVLQPMIDTYPAKPRPLANRLSNLATAILDYFKSNRDKLIRKSILIENSHKEFGFGRARLTTGLRDLEAKGFVSTKKINNQGVFVYLNENVGA